MPLLCGTYLLQYIDKQALSYSAVFDLFTSTKTTSDEYSWLTSIFYFGYLVSEWPSSYLAQHFPTGKVLSCFVVTWGSVLMLTAACSNFTGLAICRFILGCLEAPIVSVSISAVVEYADVAKDSLLHDAGRHVVHEERTASTCWHFLLLQWSWQYGRRHSFLWCRPVGGLPSLEYAEYPPSEMSHFANDYQESSSCSAEA